MAESEAKKTKEVKKTDGEAATSKKLTGKKARPTNCTECNKRIRRNAWYYLNGGYYCGKNCAKIHGNKKSEEKAKTNAEAKEKAADQNESKVTDGAVPSTPTGPGTKSQPDTVVPETPAETPKPAAAPQDEKPSTPPQKN